MRMSMRRFTLLTNGLSKKLENHEHALVFYFMYYNFCRIHQALQWCYTFKCTTTLGFHPIAMAGA